MKKKQNKTNKVQEDNSDEFLQNAELPELPGDDAAWLKQHEPELYKDAQALVAHFLGIKTLPPARF